MDCQTPAGRCLQSVGILFIAAFFAALLVIVTVFGYSPDPPIPLLFFLFSELVGGVVVLSLLKLCQLWFPKMRIWNAIFDQSMRGLRAAAIVAFCFVAFGVGTGIAFALGIL